MLPVACNMGGAQLEDERKKEKWESVKERRKSKEDKRKKESRKVVRKGRVSRRKRNWRTGKMTHNGKCSLWCGGAVFVLF